ncbi:GxxExxY protein [Thermodesulfobacteriota bacterium]
MDLLYKKEAYNIVGCCLEVHKELGCGFLEPVYQEALEREFKNQNVPFARETELPIYYKNEKLNKYYQADFVCYEKIIVELKALSELTSQHEAQVLNYLKATGFELGLLINFGQMSLQYKRIIKTKN